MGGTERTRWGICVNDGGDGATRTGEGFFAPCASPDDAARCAIERQRTLRQHRKDTGFAPKVRIGIHAGPILEADGELVGQQVHLAARIGSAAARDEILLSHEAVVELDDTFRVGDQYDVDAKGIAEPVAVAPLDWM